MDSLARIIIATLALMAISCDAKRDANIFSAIHGATATNYWRVGSNGYFVQEHNNVASASYDGNFSLTKENLFGVWAGSPNIAVVVGQNGFISRYGGINFFDTKYLPVPALHDVWGFSLSEVWTVGYGGAIFSFDPAKTTFVPESSGTSSSLWAVWGASPSDLWVVGDEGTILRRQSGLWTAVPSGTASRLTDLWASGPNDLWVVGEGGTVLHGDGARFVAEPSPTRETLYGIAGSGPRDIWAVGDRGQTLHYDGHAFLPVPTSSEVRLLDVWSRGPDDVIAVGESGTRLFYDGYLWHQGGFLSAFWGASKNDIWYMQTGSSMLHYDGQRWSLHKFDAGKNNASITGPYQSHMWGSGSSDIWATIGRPGEVVHYDGAQWSPVKLQPEGEISIWINGVWGLGKEAVWAVGSDEGIVHYDGTQWVVEHIDRESNLRLFAVWGSAPDQFYAVGEKGLILKREADGTWIQQAPPTGRSLYAVFGLRGNSVYAAGADGAIFHLGRGGWTAISTKVHSDLYSIWGYRSPTAPPPGPSPEGPEDLWDEIWMVGKDRAVLKKSTSQAAFESLDVAQSPVLCAIWGSGPGDVWLIGDKIQHLP